MIRHARGPCQPLALPIVLLPVAVIEPAFQTLLMASVGATLLLTAGLPPALVAAVAMAAITVRADVEDGLTRLPATRSREQNSLIMNCRVVHCHRGRARQGQPFYVRLEPYCKVHLMKVYRLEPYRAKRQGSIFPSLSHDTRLCATVDDERACGADDVACRLRREF